MDPIKENTLPEGAPTARSVVISQVTHRARNGFTKEDGLLVQKLQLERAEKLYSAPVFAALKAEVEKANAALPAEADGYDVMRGQRLDEFATSWCYREYFEAADRLAHAEALGKCA